MRSSPRKQCMFRIAASGGCSSEVGTKALDITKGDKEENATMFLNLSGNDRHKEHLVMHEFGHALGLGHEHQRAVFWDNIGKFFKKDVVEKFFNSFTSFQTDGASLGNTPGIRSEKYDPHSIMHYWYVSVPTSYYSVPTGILVVFCE